MSPVKSNNKPFRWDVLQTIVLAMFRAPLLSTLACVALHPLWLSFAQTTGLKSYPPVILFLIGTHGVREVLFVSFAVFVYMCDHCCCGGLRRPPASSLRVLYPKKDQQDHYRLLQHCRIHPYEKVVKQFEQNPKLVSSTVRHIAREHFLIQPLWTLFIFTFFAHDISADPLAPLPESYLEIYMRFFVSNIINEVSFYTLHRMMHFKPPPPQNKKPQQQSNYDDSNVLLSSLTWSARVVRDMVVENHLWHNMCAYLEKKHRVHHEYVYSFPWTADFADPIESYFFVILPTFLQCVRGEHSHVFMWVVNSGWRVFQNYEIHLGYDFSKTFGGRLGLFHGRQARFHEYHHNSRTTGFGLTMMMDFVMSTMDDFLEENPVL